ncbi:LptF/LptG family permease [Aegicerativicinus sediminis]|uniref:LptF/LptG family permease n=1 Tax=Aegicerativicinus sediminis TaxID=2893202 RepID=UPI001E2A1CD6|nr:LptF/LptG family permease [Aegicerativicinus sediminis]
MKILDWYILKRYLLTFFMMLLLFIPIGITVNLAEKIGKILENKVPFAAVAQYYLDFTIYFATLLLPIFLFLSVIWFTSKLANNTEVVAFLSSGVSYTRFLRPYLIGATLIAILALVLGMYLAPSASDGFNKFKYRYFKSSRDVQQTVNIYRQINDNEYIYVSNFDPRIKRGYYFTLEHFEGTKMTHKISANNLVYNEEDSTYTLNSYTIRKIGEDNEIIESKRKQDTVLDFSIDDLTPVQYIAETLSYGELTDFIEKERERGSSNINRYLVVKYKKWSLPVSVFILTIIAVAVSSMKRRGGMGINLAFGITIAMIFVFFDKVFGVMAEQSDFSPLIAVWLPVVIFGIFAFVLLQYAKR